MADLGSINVEVKSEGAEDAGSAAQDAAQGGGGGGGGGGGDGGGLATAITGGIVGGLVSQAFGPLLDIVDPVLKILQAFVAPLAATLMRLLTPVLRFFIKLLPMWMDFLSDPIGAIQDAVDFIWPLITALPGQIWRFVQDLAPLIWDKVKQLAGNIATALLGEGVTDMGSAFFNALKNWFGGDDGGLFSNADPNQQTARERQMARFRDGEDTGGNGNVSINFFGGIEEIIESWTLDSGTPGTQRNVGPGSGGM